ncbi:DUF3016 domain-containing protein [Hyphomicrobium sp.]|uniref:DUF3016 domain-containing protein n=1 Tax=Hyphomicrobium sp. TaxID=82 RepID=UPI0025B92ED7|nr:DUF3016 domain-containing protein [Hyphomicrobium sp.]MCC7252085.1 DUF3016 domain-containing protein [Hyphomicrobium sp.]
MRHWQASIVAMVFAGLLPSVGAAAAVNVTFVAPERYRDFRSSGSRNATLNQFRRIFTQLGTRYLKPGQSLSIDVLDIDLAGEYEPWSGRLNDVRIMRDITPPRIRMRYVLRENGRVLARAEETVSDMNYLMNPSARRSGEQLAYEKDMLRDWFRSRFGSARPR